ncbi:radical SAM protein [Haloimpatiens sp. FM7330]|uniref:radical SAM protein n=1 Tax=Haloimpatiens sp. FM7330 TaxID=3298610 RepID=UPI00363811CC
MYNLSDELIKMMDKAWRVRSENFTNDIEFDIPVKTLPVSVTGEYCELKCAHCNGHYLKGMTPVENVDKQVINEYDSFLVSGGCNKEGVVELDKHLEFLKQLKDSGKKINMHLGLIDEEKIEKIKDLADCVSFDFVVDDETIKEVYGLNKTYKDYINTYKKLKDKTKVVPHICIGLKGGEVKGECKALDVLKEIGVDALVFIIFIPTQGTVYENRKSPHLDEIVKILAQARVQFPDKPIHLGCMKAKGKIRKYIDYYAVKCGVNKIVNPTDYAVKAAEELQLSIKKGQECCVL